MFFLCNYLKKKKGIGIICFKNEIVKHMKPVKILEERGVGRENGGGGVLKNIKEQDVGGGAVGWEEIPYWRK